jgi:hypothetical protein
VETVELPSRPISCFHHRHATSQSHDRTTTSFLSSSFHLTEIGHAQNVPLSFLSLARPFDDLNPEYQENVFQDDNDSDDFACSGDESGGSIVEHDVGAEL